MLIRGQLKIWHPPTPPQSGRSQLILNKYFGLKPEAVEGDVVGVREGEEEVTGILEE